MYWTRSAQSDESNAIGNGFKTVKPLIAVLVIILNSCSAGATSTNEPASVDRSFLTGEPCTPPCWYGLEVNQSTEAEVLSKLDQLPFIEHNTYREYSAVWIDDENAKEVQFNCLSPSKAVCGGALLSTGVLKKLWLRVGYDLSLKAAVDQIGPPDFLSYGALNVEGGCRIVLWWPERGIAIDSTTEKSYADCQSIAEGNGVSPNMMARLIIYFANEGLGTPGDCCPRIPWPGFAES